jgi:uncharacterized membrane protein
MGEFLAAIAVFVVAHMVPTRPPVRTFLIGWIGRRAYIVCYSLLSVLLLIWVIVAARRAPYVPLWHFASWQVLVPVAVMPLAAWLLIVGLVFPNPLSISVRASAIDDLAGPAVAITRHPVLWAFLLWTLSHIPPNGDVVALTLFGGMALLALGGIFTMDRRARRALGEERWLRFAAATSLVPFAALFAGRASLRPSWLLLLSTVVALFLYVWFLARGHAWLIGPDPLALLS